jgi:sedoheptulose-bisphosphatase
MREAAKALVGEDRLLTTSTLVQIFVSPRQRAKQTLAIFGLPSHIPVTETQELCEWDYGDYEGVTTSDIKKSRPNGEWDIWKDGCPGGESPKDVSRRVDGLIAKIREIHMDAKKEDKFGDVVLVAHAHILRSFTARWLNLDISAGRHFLLDAGGVGVLWCDSSQVGANASYEHKNFDEPAVDCWNVTDGIALVGTALIDKERVLARLSRGLWMRQVDLSHTYIFMGI